MWLPIRNVIKSLLSKVLIKERNDNNFWYTLKALFFYQHHIVLILSPFIVCTFSWFFNDIDDTQSIEALLITKPKTNPKSSYRL